MIVSIRKDIACKDRKTTQNLRGSAKVTWSGGEVVLVLGTMERTLPILYLTNAWSSYLRTVKSKYFRLGKDTRM